ncbi:antA/AntB antirepressor family protein [Tenacibaculum piscium]|uniref:antA/AntB antirepressor family protein n=1 Tax=Tenacibaculum piscium TaxID=1458515 RepID=UPI00187B7864|nr:antA/AntB antirepressor family protein [Tenacibaculum piscium]MBE7691143.1 hypothetical protein [Tenacibaculum piscium]
MKNLIQITEQNGNNVISARELHGFLEVGKDFSTWVKDRINKYEFIENEDYTIHKVIECKKGTRGGRPRIDYSLSVNLAKTIVRNEKYGKNKPELIVLLSKEGKEGKEVVIAKERIEFIFGREIVENLFSEYTICSQYSVFGGEYRIDWYIPELNLAVEFDENHHLNSENKRLDEIRQNRIEAELGCKFLRYKQ